MPCCVVPPADTGVVEVAHEDKGLWKWGCSFVLVEGDTWRPLHRAAVIGLDTYQSSILFLIVFFVIVHSVPIDSVLYRQSIRGLIDFG